MTTGRQPFKHPVLITGSSGLIGSRLSQRLAGKTTTDRFEVTGFDLQHPGGDHGLSAFHEVDLTDEDSTRRALEKVKGVTGGRLASVVHLAAYYDFSGEPSPLYQELTVNGTRRLMRLLHELELIVEQFIFSSTLLVMQPDEQGGRISEDSQTEAEWVYPQSKLDTEQVLRETHGDIPLVILRIAGVYDEQCHSLPIAQQISRIYERQLESYLFPGDPTHGQAFVHLNDLVDCICQAIARRKALNKEEIFLIAEPDVMHYDELQNRIGELLYGTQWPTIRIPKTVAKAGAWLIDKLSSEKPFIKPWMIDLADDHYEPNIAHAQTHLLWEPRERLRTTLPHMIEFLKQDPERFYAVNKLPEPAGVHH